MNDLPNPLRDRREAEKARQKDDKPISFKELLGKRMMPTSPRRTRGDMIRLALVAILLLVVIGGMVFVKTMEVTKPLPKDEAERRAKLQKIETLPEDDLRWDGMQQQFKDNGDPVDVNSKEFLYFVDIIKRQYTKDKVHEQTLADREVLLARREKAYGEKTEYPNATLNRMMWDYPQISRGKFFKITGQLIEIYPEVINTPNQNNVKDMWMCVMRDAQTARPVHFYTAQIPLNAEGKPFAEKLIEEKDVKYKVLDNAWCEIEGIFLKVRPYESMRAMTRGGNQQREAAVVMAGTFRELPPPPKPPDVGRAVAMGVALVAVIMGSVILVGVLIARKYYRSTDMRLKLAINRIRREKAAASATEPDWKSIEE